LYVGVNRPHKNVATLIRAFDLLEKELGASCPALVVAGAGFNEAVSARSRGRGKILLTGHVVDEELVELYRGATALILPSFYEGFGLPILEAMTVGTPVVTSNCSAMAEIAGDAGVLLDPDKPEKLVDAMKRLATDADERERRSRMGRRRAGLFSWQRAAAETEEVYKEVLNCAGDCH